MSRCFKVPNNSTNTGSCAQPKLLQPLGLQFHNSQLEELFATQRHAHVLRRLRCAAFIGAVALPLALAVALILSSDPGSHSAVSSLLIGIAIAVLCAVFAIALDWDKYQDWRAKPWTSEALGVALAALSLIPVGLVAAEAEASFRALLIDLVVSMFYTYVPVRVKMSWPLVVFAPIACAITTSMYPSSTDISAVLLVVLAGLAYVARRAREFQERQTFAMTDQSRAKSPPGPQPVEPDVEPDVEEGIKVTNVLKDMSAPVHSEEPCKESKRDEEVNALHVDLELEKDLMSQEWQNWAQETEDLREKISTPRGTPRGEKGSNVVSQVVMIPCERSPKEEMVPPTPQSSQNEAPSVLSSKDETPNSALPDQPTQPSTTETDAIAAVSTPSACESDHDDGSTPDDCEVSALSARLQWGFQNKPSEPNGDLDCMPQITPRERPEGSDVRTSPVPASLTSSPPVADQVLSPRMQNEETSIPRGILKKSGSKEQVTVTKRSVGIPSQTAEGRRVSFDATHGEPEDEQLRQRTLTDVARALRWESVESSVFDTPPESTNSNTQTSDPSRCGLAST